VSFAAEVTGDEWDMVALGGVEGGCDGVKGLSFDDFVEGHGEWGREKGEGRSCDN